MKKLVLLWTICISGLVTNAQRTDVPAELLPFVKTGYDVLDFAKGNLDDDMHTDYLLVLVQKGEDTVTFNNAVWEIPRILVLLKGSPGGRLKNFAENNEVVYCRQCGGVMGDPYQGITVKDQSFTVEHYGGSSWRWTAAYTFTYDKIKKDWFLSEDVSGSFHSTDPENTETSIVIKRDEAGEIPFSAFKTEYNTDSTSWKVKSARSYFYQSPDTTLKPGKAFLIKGDVLRGVKTFRRFVYGYFENSQGKTTSGFLLRNDLEPLR